MDKGNVKSQTVQLPDNTQEEYSKRKSTKVFRSQQSGKEYRPDKPGTQRDCRTANTEERSSYCLAGYCLAIH